MPFHPKAAPVQINFLPFEAKQFAFSQSCRQLRIVHLEDAALLGFLQKGGQLLDGQCFHLPMFQLR